ncbi:Intracellular distribution of mitochondria [Puccinia graminis f. sp. tritici]|uniref:Clustered mitochondria protein homolog n=1 Tax=Puccinia graminis f. sp. tritici TaxID=56615 RepID=A0A5B0QC09_PUCGR|nr:Intracellular distribution of mitochondria [Puccinia graminis f. sp. tritici]
MAVDPTPEVTELPANQEKNEEEAKQSQNDTTPADPEPAGFQLSIFIPRPNFCSEVNLTPSQPNADPEPESEYIELILPAHGPETIRELQQSVIESAEGWWLGSIGLASVELDPNGKPDPQQLSVRTVYGEFAELSSAFQSDKFKDPDAKRALLAINIDYTEYSARLHVIRLRDVLYSQAPGLLVGNPTPFPPYDPSQIGISGAVSLFPFVRGDQGTTGADSPASEQNLTDQPGTGPSKNKKKKKSSQPTSSIVNMPQAAPEPAAQESAIESLGNYRFNSSNPFGVFSSLMGEQSEPREPNLSARYLKSFALSTWNSPPHHYRLRGHYLYLAITTFENVSYEITCHTKGFYVNKSTKTQFDPSPSSDSSPDSVYFHTLTQLICTLSPAFVKQVTQTWNRALNPAFPDFFTSISITNCLPAFPWLVNPEKPSPDAIRSQLAYLITGSTTAETLPPARDWADEFAQARELPRKSLAERILRERIWSRLQSDFSMAATRGVISCSRGEVPALNPQEPESAWTYVLNNILFSRAEDPIGAYEHLGGTAAARAIASKDLHSIKYLNQLDVPGIYTMGSAVVDYHGKRWIAQGMIPGIFRPPDLEAEKAQQDLAAQQSQINGHSTPDDKDEGDWEKVNRSLPVTPQLGTVAVPEEVSPPTTYDILYGSADIEKPEMGLRSDPKFHRLAAQVAAGFNLSEHDVIDVNGRTHRLWLSADVHGIRATDGRCYLIDLYRMAPLDVSFIQNDIDGPILDGKTPISEPAVSKTSPKPTQDTFPHRFTVIRTEAINAFKQHKFRQFALNHIKKHKQQQQASQTTADSKTDGKSIEASTEGLGDDVVVDPDISTDDGSDASVKENFEFGLNPDAFVDRKDQPWTLPQDKEDQGMALVKELSKYVREQLLVTVVQDLSEVKGLPADGRRLSDFLHSRGVNIRYLGHITHRLQLLATALSASPDNKTDQNVILNASIGLLQSEMVFRACKHILNEMLLNTSENEACHCISHFLNCLLGQSAAVPSSEQHLDSSSTWRTCTRQSLRSLITSSIRRRFRYALPNSYFTQRLPRTKIQLLREICTRMGIQLCLRDYNLCSPSPEAITNGHAQVVNEQVQKNAETVQATEEPVPATNGHTNCTDDENSTEGATPNESAAPSAPKQLKKKKKSKSKKGTASSSGSVDGQTFSPSDILNILPIVRDSTCRSSVADELYAEGRKAFSNGDIALGQELCTDALTTYEQVFGSVHPEMCRHWHSLAILYHQLSQRTLVELSEYNDRLLELSAIYHSASNEEDREKVKERIESYQRDREPEALKNEIDTYIQLAANNLRQSVIVAERTLGLDHPETIQQYSDLSVMEYHLGNSDTAMRYTKHALELWHVVYGPGCHPDASASVTHAGVLAQSTLDPSKSPRADSIFGLSQALIGSFFGTDSGKFAEATLILSQMFAQSGQKEQAIKFGLEAKKLYANRFGEDHDQTKQANQLHDSICRSIEAQIKGDEEKSNRLAKRLGLDPKRAASLRARLLASSSSATSAVSAESSLAQKTPSDQRLIGPQETLAPKIRPPVQNGSPVSIDDLVKYIQGSSSTKSSKATNGVNSPSASTSRTARQPSAVKTS